MKQLQGESTGSQETLKGNCVKHLQLNKDISGGFSLGLLRVLASFAGDNKA